MEPPTILEGILRIESNYTKGSVATEDGSFHNICISGYDNLTPALDGDLVQIGGVDSDSMKLVKVLRRAEHRAIPGIIDI